MPTSTTTEPVLPPELECTIFQLAAWEDMDMIRTLMLVARRVKTWMSPLRYRVCRIEDDEDLEALWRLANSYPDDCAHTTHLTTVVEPESMLDTISRLVQACPNLVDLRLCGAPPVADDMLAIAALPHLRRLSMSPSDVFLNADDDGHPAFLPLPGLTHLELLEEVEPTAVPWIARAFPGLTHLSFNDVYLPTVMQRALKTLHGLHVCVYVYRVDDWDWDKGRSPVIFEEHRAALAPIQDKDLRLVALLLVDLDDDWERGAWGGQDYWAWAEEEVATKSAATTRKTVET
ncbi:hypothetical protein MIND_00583300 [Mycena indigotica]|uniref:F-box domain-containing protein n=1 Tax=Mycena indigotica TaxID=2126181 RepID=A0A8H6W5G0_9AGAR|nr:uncharacterized protein MIND_00583300 [Mycena indigotica]KAF7303541.1 hypothetical protein MIND_00583300 [Mycena indigotica]